MGQISDGETSHSDRSDCESADGADQPQGKATHGKNGERESAKSESAHGDPAKRYDAHRQPSERDDALRNVADGNDAAGDSFAKRVGIDSGGDMHQRQPEEGGPRPVIDARKPPKKDIGALRASLEVGRGGAGGAARMSVTIDGIGLWRGEDRLNVCFQFVDVLIAPLRFLLQRTQHNFIEANVDLHFL